MGKVFKFKEQQQNEGLEPVIVYKHYHTTEEALHSHDFFEIAYIYSGCGEQIINGDLIILDKTDKHCFIPHNGLGIYNCLISPEFIDKQLSSSFDAIDILSLSAFQEFNMGDISSVIRFQPNQAFRIEEIFSQMEDELKHKESCYRKVVHNCLENLLVHIFREISKNDTLQVKQNVETILPEIINYIEENYNQKISLTEIARKNFYSPNYFSKIFKESQGKTLTQFISEFRIKESIKMLETTDFSIESIAYNVGYKDKKNFYSAFKKMTGMTPKTYKLKVQRTDNPPETK